MFKRSFSIFIIAILVALALPTTTPTRAQEGTGAETYMVPMPDGVSLATSVVLPDGEGPFPVLLVRTPYGRISELEVAGLVSRFGVATVAQDTRGRFDSEGYDWSFRADRDDGQATLDWITAQPWSNGRIATFGGSALGITQYMMAPGASDALRCQLVFVATPDLYRHAVYQGGVLREALAVGWLTFNESQHLIAPFTAEYLNGEFWDDGRIVDYSQVNAAAIHIGGWYDIFARGTVAAFQGYQNEGGPGARGQQHLVMGPWVHGFGATQVGDLAYPEAEMNLAQLLIPWVSRCLLLDEVDLSNFPTVQYFTMGAVDEPDAPGNVWQEAEEWPPSDVVEESLYLHPDNHLDIEPADADGGGDTFIYDPADPSPSLGGQNLILDNGAYDQREVEEREDVVVYSTVPLAEAVEVTGNMRAEIWFTTDVVDTDIVVRVTDVYPDGRSMLVADGIFRARFRNSPDFTSEELLTPGESYAVTVDLGPTSIVFNEGHRIRISVTSSNAPRFLPNPNTGAMFGTGIPATTTILHSEDYPSALVLPVR